MANPTGLPQRRRCRLADFDYTTPGAYFVTVCATDHSCLFGAIVDGFMRPSEFGSAVQACWHDLPNHYVEIEIEPFVLMPNHVHGVISIRDAGAGLRPAGAGLPEIMRAFKSFSSRRINELRGTPGAPVWQRGYHEHVVRGAADLDAITQYIVENPGRWSEDRENRSMIACRTAGPV